MKYPLQLAVLVGVFTCSPVGAQTAGRVGFNFRVGDQNAIGMTWHLTDRFAFRPLLTYDSRDLLFFDPFVGPIEERVQVYGADFGFLFTVHLQESLNLYAGISLQYDYSNVEFGRDIRTEGAEALFGIRYMLAKRLGVFGDLGAERSHGIRSVHGWLGSDRLCELKRCIRREGGDAMKKWIPGTQSTT